MKLSQLTLLFLILFSFFSCRKYQDGPSLSLLSKTNRLSNDWILYKAIKESAFGLSDFTDRYPTFRLRIRKDTSILIFSPIVETIRGNWQFIETKEAIQFTFTHDPITLIRDSTLGITNTNLSYDSISRFDIRLLTQDELKIVDKYNNILTFIPE